MAELSGTGAPPVGLSSSSLEFGNQVVDTASLAKTVSLTNYQTVPLSISVISLSGDYSQSSNCSLSPNTLASRSSCSSSVTFTPTARGGRNGRLTASANG